MTSVRYDGFQVDLFGGGAHCYTIVDPASPAFGFGISFDAVMPTEQQVSDAVREKEQQVSSGDIPSAERTRDDRAKSSVN